MRLKLRGDFLILKALREATCAWDWAILVGASPWALLSLDLLAALELCCPEVVKVPRVGEATLHAGYRQAGSYLGLSRALLLPGSHSWGHTTGGL